MLNLLMVIPLSWVRVMQDFQRNISMMMSLINVSEPGLFTITYLPLMEGGRGSLKNISPLSAGQLENKNIHELDKYPNLGAREIEEASVKKGNESNSVIFVAISDIFAWMIIFCCHPEELLP